MLPPLPVVQLPNLGPIVAPPGTWGTIGAALQCFLIAVRFEGEMQSPVLYSKFAADTTKYSDPMPGKIGMFLAYFPASLMSLFLSYTSSFENLAAILLFVHFVKRLLEVLFVHKFGGTMSKAACGTISTFYTFDSYLVAATALPISQLDPLFLKTGILLFVIGQAGNLYHHYLLSTLRSDKNGSTKGRYLPPKGGLFSLVATPHYLFELVSWLGIAFASQNVIGFLEVLSHASYLMGRAYNTNQLYFKQFTENQWPRSRKNIFPFLY